MGLDNGLYIHSDKRLITRDMLPKELIYPFDSDYNDNVEISYHRKDWGLRNEIVSCFGNKADKDGYYFHIDTPDEVFKLIKIIVSFMDKETWEEEGDSIWEYEEALPNLRRDVINLAIIAAYMYNNPDVSLIFYDSY
jgi:hypothetical protein